MDRGAWEATVHRVAKKLDMTERLTTTTITLVLAGHRTIQHRDYISQEHLLLECCHVIKFWLKGYKKK